MSDETIGTRIRTLRTVRGLTQADLAAEVGVTRSHVTKIENGDDEAGGKLLASLAQFFDVSLDWLRTGRGEQHPCPPLSEKERLLIEAFRQLPEDEGDAHLALMLKRVKKPGGGGRLAS